MDVVRPARRVTHGAHGGVQHDGVARGDAKREEIVRELLS